MINIIGNAFKFTHEGSITGGCMVGSNKELIFHIVDTGIGIPPEKYHKIFERFAQLESNSNRFFGGTGLGLSIVKGLVELLGGTIWLESLVGKGTTFFFSLPLKTTLHPKTKAAIVKTENTVSFSGNKAILVVEDDVYNTAFIKEILDKSGLKVTYVQYGADAIQNVQKEVPDLILMDISLPDMSGYDATREIKKMYPHIIIIAQTAYAASEDKEKALNSGCDDHISKPIRSNDLLSIINQYLSKV
ncbi:MAG: response regulator [Bacteroidetes bacterium]|nr:response regulator [Bacteroidota bacterium]